MSDGLYAYLEALDDTWETNTPHDVYNDEERELAEGSNNLTYYAMDTRTASRRNIRHIRYEIMAIASAGSDHSDYGNGDDDCSTMSSASIEHYQYPLEAAGYNDHIAPGNSRPRRSTTTRKNRCCVEAASYNDHIAPKNSRPSQEHDDAEEPVLCVLWNGVYESVDVDEAADALAERDEPPSAADTLEEDAGDADTQYQTGGGPLLRSQSCAVEDTDNEGVIDNDVLPPGYRFTVEAETTRRINRFRLDRREITMAIRRPPQDPDTNTVSWLQGAVLIIFICR
ncbi:uncharacterized protein LOC112494914 [Cephus cinctus]|uniref:Uncharacterized protein LOC112494914 n=1 Tax=Cephus cinctus TaxID=211228 RepID=A0AAJ7W4S3_CEPCN|nr:uncharacterized protein LOC112494914 [Cephus cinctus]